MDTKSSASDVGDTDDESIDELLDLPSTLAEESSLPGGLVTRMLTNAVRPNLLESVHLVSTMKHLVLDRVYVWAAKPQGPT
jgi:hypothetical protein